MIVFATIVKKHTISSLYRSDKFTLSSLLYKLNSSQVHSKFTFGGDKFTVNLFTRRRGELVVNLRNFLLNTGELVVNFLLPLSELMSVADASHRQFWRSFFNGL